MKWFKFYGQDYLSDPKILSLSGSERSCWITLLAYGSVNDNGVITFLDEAMLMVQAGISPMDDEWEKTKGILEKLEKLQIITNDNGVITIINWKKRQEANLTGYERVKKHREKKKNDNKMITLDKIRIDKNRYNYNTKTLKIAEALGVDPTETMDRYVVEDYANYSFKTLTDTLVEWCRENKKKPTVLRWMNWVRMWSSDGRLEKI